MNEVPEGVEVAEEVVVDTPEVEAPVEEAGTEVLEDGTVITDHIVTAEDVSSAHSEVELTVGDVVGLVTDPAEDEMVGEAVEEPYL